MSSYSKNGRKGRKQNSKYHYKIVHPSHEFPMYFMTTRDIYDVLKIPRSSCDRLIGGHTMKKYKDVFITRVQFNKKDLNFIKELDEQHRCADKWLNIVVKSTVNL